MFIDWKANSSGKKSYSVVSDIGKNASRHVLDRPDV